MVQLVGQEIIPYVSEVARFRIEHFRAFPYLYVGSAQYEEEYLKGYASDPRSLLNLLFDADGSIVAVATSMPLVGPADILKNVEELFNRAGENPSDYFYVGEVIVIESFRGKGLAKELLRETEAIASTQGFRKFCLSVVEREDFHPLRPQAYVSTDPVWRGAGYRMSEITSTHEWPTLSSDGSVQDQSHRMRFWLKG